MFSLKKILWFFCLLFSCVSVMASLQNLSLQQEFLIPSSDWVLFVKKYGAEKVFVKFPSDPKVEYDLSHKGEEKKWVQLSSLEQGAQYIVLLSPRQEDFQKALQNHLDYAKGMGFEKIEVRSRKNGSGGEIADILYKNASSHICKSRIITTSKAVFSFFTVFEEGASDKHTDFIASFSIER